MFNFNNMNSQNLCYGYSVSLYDDFGNSWYFIAISIQNFFQTSNANEGIAVGFCFIQSLHRSGSILMKSAEVPETALKGKALVFAQIKFTSSQSIMQGKLLWLQIFSSCKITFWIAICRPFLHTS